MLVSIVLGLTAVILLLLAVVLYVWYHKPELVILFTSRVELFSAGLNHERRKVGNFQWSFLCRGGLNHKKPTMVILHGFSLQASVWAQLCRHLPRDQYIVIPDLPGHGDTSLADISDDMYPTLAEKVHEFLEVAGLAGRPVHLVGHSMGGAIATCYAAKYSDDVVALSVICPAIRTPTASAMLKEISDGKTGCLIDFTLAGVLRLHAMGVHKQKPFPEQIVEGLLRLRSKKRDFYTELHRKLFLPENLERPLRDAKRVNAASQVIWGAQDEILDASGATSMKSKLDNCQELHILPQCGHLVPIEFPQMLAHLLVDFQKKHARQTF